MIKKATFLCGLLLAATSILSAQTQQGYVRTLERPDNVSVALEGVTVQVRGGHNAVVSGQDGLFRLPMDGKRNGDNYTLQQVQKNGFELADQGTLGRRYAYSDKVPLTIVMVSTRQLQADKQRIANNAYQTAERTYKRQLDILEKQLSDRAISEETYRTKLQELQQNLEHYQSLVEDLADHYARTDYALLDKKEREVNLCIERGELEKADSLLATMFNPLGVLERNREALTEADRRLAEGQTLMQQAQSDLAAVLRQQEKDAEYLYQLYTIALARFDNEKARQYIETRAALDTTNVEWQNDAGGMCEDLFGDYQLALEYFQRVLRHGVMQFGYESKWTATAYNNIGGMLFQLGQHDSSMVLLQESLRIRKSVFGEMHPDVANSYNNIGSHLLARGFVQFAMPLFINALYILCNNIDENPYDLVATYENLGVAYCENGEYNKALDCYLRSLKIIEERKDSLGNAYFDIGNIYYRIGEANNQLGNIEEALEYEKKAFSDIVTRLSATHPQVANVYMIVGSIYARVVDYSKALEYYDSASAIFQKRGDIDETIRLRAQIHLEQGHYEEAIDGFEQVLKNQERIWGKGSIQIANAYDDLGATYAAQLYSQKAEKYYTEAFLIREIIYGESHLYTAKSYDNLGSIYSAKGQYGDALRYYTKSMEIRKGLLDGNHPLIAVSCGNIGQIYMVLGQYDSAYRNFERVLNIDSLVYGQEHPRVADAYSMLGNYYGEINNVKKQIEYKQKALEIYENKYGDRHPMVALFYIDIGSGYLLQKDFQNGIKYTIHGLTLQKLTLNPDNPQFISSYMAISSMQSLLGNYNAALQNVDSALYIANRISCNRNSPLYAGLYSMKAAIYISLGENRIAKKYLRKAIRIQRRTLGRKHPATLKTKSFLKMF